MGKRIKALRIKNGYTQEELGNILGVTTQAVSKWERGGTPDTELLPEISELFGVSIDHLFGLEKKERKRHLYSLHHRRDQKRKRSVFLVKASP